MIKVDVLEKNIQKSEENKNPLERRPFQGKSKRGNCRGKEGDSTRGRGRGAKRMM